MITHMLVTPKVNNTVSVIMYIISNSTGLKGWGGGIVLP